MKQFPFKYQRAYGHRTFQGCNLLGTAPNHKYTCHLKELALWGHMTNKM